MDKAKPAARRGRNATGLTWGEIAGLPKKVTRHFSSREVIDSVPSARGRFRLMRRLSRETQAKFWLNPSPWGRG